MDTFLLIAGAVLALALAGWLLAQFITPRGRVRLRATAGVILSALTRVALVWLGKTRLGRLREGRRVLQNLLNGYRRSALLYVAAKLGLADLLADGPRSSAELARSLGAHAPSLHRVLRGLVTMGVCAEEQDGRFSLTALGTWLRADRPGSLHGAAILCGEESFGSYGGLLHTVMTGETALKHVYGAGEWEHRKRHPELNYHFNAGLTVRAAGLARAVLAAYDFSSFRTIADVGGSHGVLLAAILKAHPSVTGILFDQPHVVAGADDYLKEAGVAGRCQVVGGSFFDRLPDGADAHILKHVLHDWQDEQALAILRTCHRALKDKGTLLLVEQIMPARTEDDPDTIWLDLHMLTVTGGRERSEAEFRALLAAAGFTLTRVIPTRSRFSIIECVRAAAEGGSSPPGPAIRKGEPR